MNSSALSSASVALTVALHEASSERLTEIQTLDKAIIEVRTLIRNIHAMYGTQSILPKDLFSSKAVFHLYQMERASAMQGLNAELESLKTQRLELLKTHQQLHVQGLIAQMQCLAGVGTRGAGGGRSSTIDG